MLYNKTEDFLPMGIKDVSNKLDTIVQSDIDIISLVVVSLYTNLLYGSKVFDNKESIDDERINGDLLIMYVGLFFSSGGGKSGTYHTAVKYILQWLDNKLRKEQVTIDEERDDLQIELKSLGSTKDDLARKAEILIALKNLKNMKDIIIDDATAEGLIESLKLGGSPSIFIDNAGKYFKMANKSEHRESVLRLVDNLYDSGRCRVKKIKSSNERSNDIHVEGLSVVYASTIGNSNLTVKDIEYGIQDGSINKVIIAIQTEAKDIPIETELSISDGQEIEKVSRSLYENFSNKNYYLSDEAIQVYYEFHSQINNQYKDYYNSSDSIAGYIIRMLKQSKRLAAIFQASESNMDFLTTNNSVDDISLNIEISDENMKKAIAFIKHYFENHFLQLMRKYGLVAREDKLIKVYSFVLKNANNGITVDKRSIIQYTKIRVADGLNSILDDMVKKNHLILTADKKYTLGANKIQAEEL